MSNSQDGCQTNVEGMTVLRLGQYGRPSLATAGLLVFLMLFYTVYLCHASNRSMLYYSNYGQLFVKEFQPW